MRINGFTNIPARERTIKLLLAALIILCAFICFPKNYKIAVQNYSDDRKEMLILTDTGNVNSKEAWFVFGKGYYFVSGITKGTVKELVIKDAVENIDDVTAYYGSVKIGHADTLALMLKLDSGPAAVATMTYQRGKIALLVILYALLCISSAAAGIFAVLGKRIKIPYAKDLRDRIKIDTKDAAVFLVLAVLYSIIVFIISRNILIKNIYPLEIAFSALTLFMTLLILKQYSGARWLTAAASVPIYACLYFSVNKICAFTFVDGDQALLEQVNIATDSLRHFEKNTARLNYMIMGTFERFNVIGKLSGTTPAKVVHWFFGACLFIYIIRFISEKLLPEVRSDEAGCGIKVLRFTALFGMVFTYNYTLEALKNFNYDLFSMTFGLAAFVHFLNAAKTKRSDDAAKAMVWAAFGTLEKQVVWPIMLMCMVEYVVLRMLESEDKPYLCCITATFRATVTALLVSAGSNLFIQHITRGDDFPAFDINNLIRPLQGMMSNVLRMVYKQWDIEGRILYIVGFITTVLLVGAGALLMYTVGKKIHSADEGKKKRASVVFIRITAAVVLIVFVLSVLSWFFTLPFGKLSAYIYVQGRSLNIFSTVALAGFVAVVLICAFRDLYRELIAIIALLVVVLPFMSGIIMNEMLGRYLNLYGICALLCQFIIVVRLIESGGAWDTKRIAAVTVGSLAVLIFAMVEVNGFAPAYLNHFPLCNVTYRGKRQSISFSVERMTAGEALLRYYHENGLDDSHVEIYINYGGNWTAKPKGWVVETFPADSLEHLGSVTLDDISFGEDVYYVFTSRGLMRRRYPMYRRPKDEIAAPFMTLTRRGAIEGYIYRSEDLRQYFEEVFETYD